jgi:tetratricopeptide (TPR) repeat protein
MTGRILLIFLFLQFTPVMFFAQNPEGHRLELIPGARESDPGKVMNDSLYTADSAYIIEQYDLTWDLYNSGNYKGLQEVALREHARVRDLVEYRDDSTLYLIYADVYSWVALARKAQGLYTGNIELIEKGLYLLEDRFGRDHQAYIENCVAAAVIYNQIGDLEQAEKYFRRGLVSSKKIFPPGHRLAYYSFNLLQNLTILFTREKMYGKALVYANERLEMAKRNKIENQVLLSFIYLGRIYLEERHFKKAFEIEDKLDSLASIYFFSPNNREFGKDDYFFLKSGLHFERGEIEKAFKKLELFNDIAERNPNDRLYFKLKISYWKQKGQFFYQLKKYKKAIKAYEEMEKVIISIGGGKDARLFDVNHSLADCYLKLGNIRTALIHRQKVLQIINKGFSEEKLFQNPSSILENFSLPFLRALVLKGEDLIRFAEKAENSQEILGFALETLGLAEEVLKAIRWEPRWQSSRLRFGKWSTRISESVIKCYFSLYEHSGDKNYLLSAFEQSQKNKGIQILAGLKEAKVKSFLGVPDSILQKEEALKLELSILRKQLHDEKKRENPNDSMILVWDSDLLWLNEQRHNLLEELERQYPEYFRLKYDLPLVSVSSIQGFLAADEAFVDYFVGDSSSYVFMIGPDTFKSLPLAHDEILRDFYLLQPQLYQYAPGILSDQEKTKQFEQFTAPAYGLYQNLLAPVLGEGLYKRLYVIPDGFLGHLPFHILLTSLPEENHKTNLAYKKLDYLFKDCAISFEYAPQLLMESKEADDRKTSVPYAGFAPAYSGGELLANRNIDSFQLENWFPEVARNGLSTLAFNQPEVDSVKTFFSSGKAFLGPDATEENFKTYGLGAQVIHLAMHALTNDENPLFLS